MRKWNNFIVKDVGCIIMYEVEDKWLRFEELPPKPKTRVIKVISKCSDCDLGIIKWNPGWRHYWFVPTLEFETGYSDRCLFTLGEVVSLLNEMHKEKKVKVE